MVNFVTYTKIVKKKHMKVIPSILLVLFHGQNKDQAKHLAAKHHLSCFEHLAIVYCNGALLPLQCRH